jgi:hypothetical protein
MRHPFNRSVRIDLSTATASKDRNKTNFSPKQVKALYVQIYKAKIEFINLNINEDHKAAKFTTPYSTWVINRGYF